MNERDEIARVLLDGLPLESVAYGNAAADALIAAGVRHLPSLVDDPEAVERVAQALLDRQVMGRRVVLANITTGEANEVRAQALAAIRALA